MNWKTLLDLVYFKKYIHSEKNGPMVLKKWFSRYELIQKYYTLSGSVMDGVFRKILKTIPKNYHVKNVLLLGLGAGGAVREIRKRFPESYITAVEYDPEMVALTKICLPKKYWRSLEIVTDDAAKVVESTQKKFDLILIDLFVGDMLPPVVLSDRFVERLVAILKWDSYLGINFFKQHESGTAVFDRFLSRWNNLRFESNRMALYRPFGNGRSGDRIPPGFVDKEQSLCFLQASIFRHQLLKIVGTPGCYGVRGQIGPLYFERYVSDIEPVIEAAPFLRLIHWQPLSIRQRRGWFHHPFPEKKSLIGVTKFQDETYWHSWPRHAKRHREKWLRETPYEIADVDFNAFAQAYHASRKRGRSSRIMWLRNLQYHVDMHPNDVHFFGARNPASQELMAGLAIVDYPDIHQSIHMVSFIHPEAEQTSVGTGLIDRSFEHGLKNGIAFMNFGVFWQKGDPKSWKAYSRFKTQFNPYFIVYPKSFYKIVWPSRQNDQH